MAGGSTPAQRWAALVGHRDNIVRLARRRGAGADAEDVAQEALLRAAGNPDLDLGRAHSYVAKVAVNLVIDLHRRATREQRLCSHAGLAPQQCHYDQQVEEIEERDVARQAARLVSRLAPELRDILLLRRDGATWSQVGAELGQPPATAEMRYRRAMLPLRRRLSPEPSGSRNFLVEAARLPRSTGRESSGATTSEHQPKWKDVP
jgi:RNA polymerase sigma-70 factor (ECF subfamily)